MAKDIVVLDSKFRIVIPKRIREELGIGSDAMLMIETGGGGMKIRVIEE